MKIFTLILFLPAVILLACAKKKAVEPEADLGLDYYPTTLGKYIVYDVDSVVYTEIPTKDTLIYKYRIKEKIAGLYTDNEGKEALRLERYIKKYNALVPYDSIAWTIKEVWAVNANSKWVQVVESNIRYTKLVFPVEANATWNGNASNYLAETNYTYEYINRHEIINSKKIDNVLYVKQLYFAPLISLQNYYEKYAKGIGLVYREITDVKSNKIISGVAVLNRIESGVVYKQSYVSMGYE